MLQHYMRAVMEAAVARGVYLDADVEAGQLMLSPDRHPDALYTGSTLVRLEASLPQYTRAEGEEGRKGVVGALVAVLQGAIAPLAGLEEVEESIEVRVRDRAYFAAADLQGVAWGLGLFPVAMRDLGGYLSAYLVYDGGDGGAVTVTRGHLKAWGVGLDELMERVVGRLSAGVESVWTAGGVEGLWMAGWPNGEGNMVPLVERRWMEELELAGDPVVMLPHPSILVVADSNEEEAIMAMLQLVASSLDDFGKRALVVAYTRASGGEGGWVPWAPDESGGEAEAAIGVVYSALTNSYVKSLYDEQKTLLDRIFASESPEAPPMVATHVLMRDPDNTRFFTYCIWAKGAEALLPKTDIIMFALPETFPAAITGKATWDDVVRVLGPDAFEPTDFDPPRWRVLASAFPDDSVLAELCA